MKSFILSIVSFAFLLTANAQTLDRSIRPKAGPAPEIKLGKTESFTLSNGLKVFVVENHKLPTIAASIQLDIRPELQGDMAGYRDMMSELLTSGTKTRSKDELNKAIDFIGARISASDEGISAQGLKKYQEKILELMSDIAMNAVISDDELQKAKTRSLSALEATANEPDAMLNNVTSVINFGKQHPYGEVATKETINNISLERVRKYYATYFRPNVAYMALVGDITAAEAKPLLEKYFGSWKKATVPVAQYSNPMAPANRRVIFVPRVGAVQSVINITYPIDLTPNSPDAIKARVVNSILGGGSNGRLFLNLREKHGWTYGSYSSISPDILKGDFTAYAKARNVVTDSSVGQILAEMDRLRSQNVPQEELKNHLSYLTGAFAIGLESPRTVAQYAINIERYHLPKDYYQNYLKNLNAVSDQDVRTVASKYVHPLQSNIIVVGSKEDVAPTLATYSSNGKVEFYDNYGRLIEPAKTTTLPANLTATDVLKKYVNAIGGEKAINNIKSIKTESTGVIQGIELTVTEVKKSPDKLKFAMTASGMVLQKRVLNGDKGYQEIQGQKAELEAEDLLEAKEDADLQAELHPEKYGKKYTLKGTEKVDGKDAYVLEETGKKNKTTLYYDVNTGYLLREVLSTEQGVVSQDYSDYKEVPGGNGYKIPYTVQMTAGPQNIKLTVTSVKVNDDFPDTEFE